ncbi:intergral membrane NMN transport protein PnuC [Salmonella enterica subsp. arizonae]|uniref:Nicotinamide riboside transporter PnuC n=1 Tax=Salmonella enterica subsp. arizonae TaxID=59203 RepID=A0A2X4TLX1_SALER|nr:intergral membrane NMN transport protein PnuC [Salmonella enterica subsp. arizonae]
MDFFSINNVMVNIPLGEGGYALSWIEAIGTIFGLLCIWCASREKIINYLFGLINVTLFAAIFFQIQLYASLLLQVFFFAANIYGWYAWSRQNDAQEAALKVRWLLANKHGYWGRMYYRHSADDVVYRSGIRHVDPRYARPAANGRHSGGYA